MRNCILIGTHANVLSFLRQLNLGNAREMVMHDEIVNFKTVTNLSISTIFLQKILANADSIIIVSGKSDKESLNLRNILDNVPEACCIDYYCPETDGTPVNFLSDVMQTLHQKPETASGKSAEANACFRSILTLFSSQSEDSPITADSCNNRVSLTLKAWH